jgi:hypothetical protein
LHFIHRHGRIVARRKHYERLPQLRLVRVEESVYPARLYENNMSVADGCMMELSTQGVMSAAPGMERK